MGNDQQNPTLTEAVALFLATLSPSDKQTSQQELSKFARWCGWDRHIGDLTIREVASYAEQMGVFTTSLMKRLEPVRAFLTYTSKQGLIKTNLAAHLRVRKDRSKRRLTTGQQTQQVTPLTPQGHAKLTSELAALKGQRLRIAAELHRAAADKDIRENAPLEAARESRGQLEARIRELETTLNRATIISGGKTEDLTVEVGRRVTLRDLDSNEELSYALVSPTEANPAAGKISFASPTGKALLNRAKGDIVEVTAPMGKIRYRIEQVEP